MIMVLNNIRIFNFQRFFEFIYFNYQKLQQWLFYIYFNSMFILFFLLLKFH